MDTHALVWLDRGDSALGPTARERADGALRTMELAVSAISFWEIAMLLDRGRMTMKLPLDQWRLDLLRSGLAEIAIDGRIGIEAAGLDGFHADPADRIIVASTLATGATLATADQRILNWRGDLDRLDARR